MLRARTRGRWHPLRTVTLAGLLAVIATACNTPVNELGAGREHIEVAARGALGHVLVDDEGRTLYLFEKDEAHESYCTGACASVWPPLTTKGMPTVQGVDASKVTLIKRDDGLTQIAYDGHPLYYYQGDTSADDTYGQEKDQFGAEWYAVTASGGKAETHQGGAGYGS